MTSLHSFVTLNFFFFFLYKVSNKREYCSWCDDKWKARYGVVNRLPKIFRCQFSVLFISSKWLQTRTYDLRHNVEKEGCRLFFAVLSLFFVFFLDSSLWFCWLYEHLLEHFVCFSANRNTVLLSHTLKSFVCKSASKQTM